MKCRVKRDRLWIIEKLNTNPYNDPLRGMYHDGEMDFFIEERVVSKQKIKFYNIKINKFHSSFLEEPFFNNFEILEE